jgi:hypothetical protein
MAVLMPSPVFRWFVPAQNGTGLVPAAGYKAKFYDVGTTTEKTIYMDSQGTPYPSPANEAELNSEGYAVIFLGTGGYKLVVTDPDDAEVATIEPLFGAGSFSTGFVDTVIASDTSGLKDADTTANHFVWCAGYWEIGDGGHGFFWNETSSTPDDTGYVIASDFDATKRWFRVPDEDGAVRAASFGYVGTRAEESSDQLLAAAAYCNNNNKTLRIGAGDDATIDTGFSEMSLYAPEFIFEAGSMFTGGGTTTTVNLYGKVSGTAEQHFTNIAIVLSVDQECKNPEWFGAHVDAVNNQPAFTAWLACGALAFTLPAGAWNVANTGSFAYPSVPLNLMGTITGTTGTTIPTGVYYPDNSRFHLHQIEFPNGATITEWDEGSGIEIVGSTDVTGSIQATVDISAAADVSAGADVTAGSTGPGVLLARGGTSSQFFPASGQWGTNVGSESTSGTAETDLFSVPLAAGVMTTAGDRLYVLAAGVYTGGLADKVVRIKIGPTTLAVFTVDVTAASWRIELNVFFYTGSITVYEWVGNGTTLSAHDTFGGCQVTPSIDFTIPNIIQVTGEAPAGGITNYVLSTAFYPAPS